MLLKDHLNFHNDIGDKEIGIEVEMEGIYLPMVVYGWSLHRDPSLRGNSMEYVLNGPTSRVGANHKLEVLYKTFYEEPNNIDPSNRCGVHIHLNVRNYTIEEIFNFIILYLIFETVLTRWCGPEREGNLFCLRATDAEWLLWELIKSRKAGFFTQSLLNQQNSKYAAINLSTIVKYGSLEFRQLGTPKRVDTIKLWLKFLLAIKDYAATEKDPIAFVSKCSQIGEHPFFHAVFGPLVDYLTYPDIDNDIMDGIRKVQAIAFTPLGKFNQDMKPQKMVFGGDMPNPPEDFDPVPFEEDDDQ